MKDEINPLLWFDFTGWTNMLLPYILPFWLILTFLYSLLIVKIVLTIYRFPKETYSFFKVSLTVSIISFCTFVLECALTHIFATLMRFNDPKYGFVTSRNEFGLSIYQNVGFFIFTLATICICLFITYRLNLHFTVPRLPKIENYRYAILIISVLTSPLIFLVSLEQVLQILFPIRW